MFNEQMFQHDTYFPNYTTTSAPAESTDFYLYLTSGTESDIGLRRGGTSQIRQQVCLRPMTAGKSTFFTCKLDETGNKIR